jgi:hypothetical protein
MLVCLVCAKDHRRRNYRKRADRGAYDNSDLEEIDPRLFTSLAWMQKYAVTPELELFFSAGFNQILNREIELKPVRNDHW